MAIYHLSIKHVQRAKGRSALAAAAYRAGAVLWDERQGKRWDYRGRRADVALSEIILPNGTGAPWAHERQSLWSQCERHDKRKNARTATELEIALPFELDDERRASLVKGFCAEIARTYRIAVDAAIHRPAESGADQVDQLETEEQESIAAGHDPRNWHCHLLMSTWTIEADGPGEKVRLFAERPDVLAVRKLWEEHCNKALSAAGIEARIDCRTLKAQGLPEMPTQHLGPTVIAMEAKGRRTERGDMWLSAKAEQRRLRMGSRVSKRPAPSPSPPPSPQASGGGQETLRNDVAAHEAAAGRRTERRRRAAEARNRLNHIHQYRYDIWITRQRWKSKLLRDQLNGNLPPELELQIAWLRRREDDPYSELIAKLRGGARVRDAGDAIFVQGQFDKRAVTLAIAMAKAHGWKVIRISGSAAFREAVAAAAEHENLVVHGIRPGTSPTGKPMPGARI